MEKTGNYSRRSFLGHTGIFLVSSLLSSTVGAAGVKNSRIVLEAKTGKSALRGKVYQTTDIWGYGGTVPGPVIRARQNDILKVSFLNNLPHSSTIHWHGIRIDNLMDGVPGLTQKTVKSGETFDYSFQLPDAGTFWYHPHSRSSEQIGRGLYGLLIVEEKEPYPVDRDIALSLDDWQLQGDGVLEDSFGNIAERARLGRVGNTLTVNGRPSQNIQVARGERARVRLCNHANARIMFLKFKGVISHIIAFDGQPVAPFEPKDGMFALGPSQRVDLLLDFKEGGKSELIETTQPDQPMANFIVIANSAQQQKAKPIALPSNLVPEPSKTDTIKVSLKLKGGKGSYLGKAEVHGKDYTRNDLARKFGYVWSVNDTAGMPGKPLFSISRGRTVELTMINQSVWPHAMHIHGHHMKEGNRLDGKVAANKLFATPGAWRDTVLLDAHETLKVSFVADNPGKWMVHCHMLEHQAGGMASWFEVM